jgi:hypothetical protein
MRNCYVDAMPKRSVCLKFKGVADDSTGPGPGADDEWDRQLRALTEGSAGQARFRELSAAERAKAGARQAKQARKRAARDARRARRTSRRAAGQSNLPRRLLIGPLVILVAVAVVSGLFWLGLGRTPRGGADGKQPGPGGTPSAGTPSAGILSAGAPAADPFSGTPAEHWQDGAAGIVIPAAHAVGRYTAAQVAAAYQTTRKLLIAAALDRQTLLGGPPTAFARLLTKDQRTQFVSGLNRTGVDKHGNELSTRIMVTSFAPGSTRLIGSVIKVSGTMSARATVDQGTKVLAVEVNYRFVYPVEPPGAPADWMRIVGAISGSVEFGDWAQASASFQPWVLFSNSDAGGRCDVNDGYVHPDYQYTGPQKVQPSGTPIDPYSMATEPASVKCSAVTRT